MSKGIPYLSYAFMLMALVVMAYCSLLGLICFYQGELLWPITFTVFGFIFSLICLLRLRKSKAMRSKQKGRPREITFSVLVLLVMALSAGPFSHFLRIYSAREYIGENIDSTVVALTGMNESYVSYANERICSYEKHLKSLGVRSSEYKEEVSFAYGENTNTKIGRVVTSLSRRLKSERMDSVSQLRREWLSSFKSFNIWNIYAPSNIFKLDEASKVWLDEYYNVSLFIYKGEQAEPFSMPSLTDRLSNVTDSLTRLTPPDPKSILIIILFYICLLLPYFVTRRPKNKVVGTH